MEIHKQKKKERNNCMKEMIMVSKKKDSKQQEKKIKGICRSFLYFRLRYESFMPNYISENGG